MFNRAKRSGTENGWADFKAAQREYKKALRNAQKCSWRRFCGGIETLPEASRLSKILSKDPGARLGAIALSTGGYSASEDEALRELMRVHFPGSTREGKSSLHRATKEDHDVARKVVNYERVRWSLETFSPFKSPGKDGIFPALLQRGADQITVLLMKIFRACLAYGYIPEAWRHARVVFIPKPGKSDYTDPKAFRPISLTSFLLKALERLVDRYIKEEALVKKPLHPLQYAYMAGRSTETALHHLVARIERGLARGQSAIGTFIDIEGAFDNTAFDSMCRALQGRDLEGSVIRWIRSMLSERTAYAELNDSKVSIRVNRGCPQGGVLSPLLWSLVVDDLLHELNGAGLYTQAYADDLVVLCTGRATAEMRGPTMRALRIIDGWCRSEGLKVNPRKAELMLFSKKRDLGVLPEVTLAGSLLEYKERVKFLGITLDPRLSWKAHIEERCQKALNAFWACKRACGLNWGLSPKILYWIYTSVIRPMLTYGAIVWLPAIKRFGIRASLDKVQRLACILITGAIRSSPTRALEVLLNLPPLPLFTEHVAVRTLYRLKYTDQLIITSFGHANIWSRVVREHPILQMQSDHTAKIIYDQDPLELVIPKRKDWSVESGLLQPGEGEWWFTDGSKLEDSTGAGLYCGTAGVSACFPLGQHATVFQAEIYAIMQCGYHILQHGSESKILNICSDSRAAILALKANVATSKTVAECKDVLLQLTRRNYKVRLTWVPGHSGIQGNEAADALAKQASAQTPMGPPPSLPIPKNVGLVELEGALRKRMLTCWAEAPSMRHAKAHISGPSQSTAREMLRLNRQDIRMVTGLLTGHFLRKHLHVMGVVEDPTCRWCLEEEETTAHILSLCPSLDRLRMKYLGSPKTTPKEIREAPISRLLKFAVASGLRENC